MDDRIARLLEMWKAEHPSSLPWHIVYETLMDMADMICINVGHGEELEFLHDGAMLSELNWKGQLMDCSDYVGISLWDPANIEPLRFAAALIKEDR